MKHTRTVDIPASAEAIWEVLEDVETWPSWTPTFEQITLQGPLEVGTDVRIKQPGRSESSYQILALEPGRRFEWGTPGGRSERADHVVEATGPDACTVTLTFEMSGLAGAIAGVVAGKKIRGMVDTEAESLQKRLSGS